MDSPKPLTAGHESSSAPIAGNAMGPGATSGKARRLGSRVLLVAWIPFLTLGLASLMASHWAPLPRPSLEEPTLAGALLDFAEEAGSKSSAIHAFHVLDGACRCSQKVATHLMDSERPAGAAETVLMIGANESLKHELEDAGFSVHTIAREDAATSLGITSVPMLVVTGRLANGDPTLRYSGGYTTRQQALEIQDTKIIEGLISGSTPDTLPVFGCGTTKALQAALDPLGIKY